MSLNKGPQQEGFLQGRMPGNPYSSTRPELGPLTRGIKKKICANFELVALLEDDGGMEHLDDWRKYKWQEEVQRKKQHT